MESKIVTKTVYKYIKVKDTALAVDTTTTTTKKSDGTETTTTTTHEQLATQTSTNQTTSNNSTTSDTGDKSKDTSIVTSKEVHNCQTKLDV